MQKPEMETLTRNTFSRKSIVVPNGCEEPAVVGKYCVCGYNDSDTWDVWIHNTKDIAAGLHANRLITITKKIKALDVDAGPLRRLDGEMVYLAMPTDTLIKAHRILGIKTRSKNKGNLHNIGRTA